MTIQGATKRLDQLTDDGSIGGNGGTAVKDGFIFDEKKGAVDFFRSANNFLKSLGALWHLIKKDEMKGTKTKAGNINSNGEDDQKAIWLAGANFGTGDWGRSTLSLKDGTKVEVDVGEIQSFKFTDPTERNVIDWVVAHELAHKLSIDHPARRTLTFKATVENDPSKHVYYFAAPPKNQPVNDKEVLYWQPRSEKDGKRMILEPPEPASEPGAGGVNALVKSYRHVNRTDSITRHGVPHVADEKIVELTGAPDRTKSLTVFSHTGFLNDHAPEVSGLQDKLADADKPKPDLKK